MIIWEAEEEEELLWSSIFFCVGWSIKISEFQPTGDRSFLGVSWDDCELPCKELLESSGLCGFFLETRFLRGISTQLLSSLLNTHRLQGRALSQAACIFLQLVQALDTCPRLIRTVRGVVAACAVGLRGRAFPIALATLLWADEDVDGDWDDDVDGLVDFIFAEEEVACKERHTPTEFRFKESPMMDLIFSLERS